MTAAGASHFEEVLTDEISEIQASRKRRLPDIEFPQSSSPDPYTQAHEAQLFGVAFSGGGIRSATFNLGILQALSELGVLRWVDYLSTVSGGGYIGSWLAAWIRRQNPETAPIAVDAVQERLAPNQRARFESEKLNPIHFLRRYSNYLTPRTGFFGADTWTMISIYLRNVILNQAILLSTLAAALILPRFAAWPFEAAEDSILPAEIAGVALFCAIVFIGRNLAWMESNRERRKAPFYAGQGGIQALIAFPVLAAAYFASVAMWQFVSQFSDGLPALAESWSAWIVPTEGFATLLFIVGISGIFRGTIKLRNLPATIGLTLVSSVVPGAFGGALLWGLAYLFDQLQFGDAGKWHALVWGPPTLVGIFSLVVVLHLGLAGIGIPDSTREWWSRLGAWLCIYSLGWFGLVALAIYGPLMLGLGAKAVAGISLTWAATTIGGLWAGRSPATGPKQSSAGMRLVAQAAPYVFVVGLLLAVSLSIQYFVPCLDAGNPACAVRHKLFDSWTALHAGQLAALHFDLLSTTPLSVLSVTLLVLAIIALVLAWRVDINEFSMHHFYRNRLVRCYLGASHERKPQAFTGFDSHDDIRLADLSGKAFTGPYPLINTTLNLVSGE
ncbi:MAG TPA: patatin-like phospholipase family protein, partial [Bryobacteraceae bacterium]|nr:patatin-like phospholipase family protein [Bryobacteraceae bacterium]